MQAFWDKIWSFYSGKEMLYSSITLQTDDSTFFLTQILTEEVEPPISVYVAAALLVAYTTIYVGPFYISSITRPSEHLPRDSPSVINARIRSVTWSCALCSICTLMVLSYSENGHPIRSLHSMGYYPVGFVETTRCLALTGILFLGPLFEAGLVKGAWRDWIRLRGVTAVLSSTVGYRNLVAGPVTEEILFRSCSVPLFVLANASFSTIVFGTPIIFGLAHVHHFYEFRLTHPRTPFAQALLRSVFQFAYTTLFGAYATFLYLRTGSLLAIIVTHTFCNWCGLPRVWGHLEGGDGTFIHPEVGKNPYNRRDEDSTASAQKSGSGVKQLSLTWSIAYYVLLPIGAVVWWKMLWPLTSSTSTLVKF